MAIFHPLGFLQDLAIELDDERIFTDKWARDCPKNYQAPITENRGVESIASLGKPYPNAWLILRWGFLPENMAQEDQV